MRAWFLAIILIPAVSFGVPPAEAACDPQELTYIVGMTYEFACTSGTFHSVRADELSGHRGAIEVCFDGGPCQTGCGSIIFYGNVQGTATIRILEVAPSYFPPACVSTTGTLTING